MATRNHNKRRSEEDIFYEAMPYTHTGNFGWADTAEEPEAPDHDFAAIEDDGRAVAIRTLVFVAIATVILCLLLLWGIQIAQEMLPASAVTPTRP